MRRVLLILTLIILPLVAAEENIYSQWHHSLDTFTVEEDVYFMTFDQVYRCFNSSYSLETEGGDPDFERMLLTRNDEAHIITLYECEDDDELEFCFDGVDCDDDRVKYEGGERYPGVKVSIWSLEPEVETNIVYKIGGETSNEPEFGEEVTAEVTITNDGNEDARNFEYWEQLPANYKIVRSNAIITDSNKIYWEGWLGPDDERKFYYAFKPMTYEDYTSEANISYEYRDQKVNTKTDKETIDVITPYEIEMTVPDSLDVNGKGTIKVSIENEQEDSSIEIKNLELIIPEELEFISFAGQYRPDQITYDLEREGIYYKWNGKIGVGEKKEWNVRFKALKKGDYTVTVNTEIDSKGEIFTEKETEEVDVDFSEIDPVIRIEPEIVKSGDTAKIVVYIDNGEKTSFANIQTKLSSALFGELSFTETEIKKGERIVFLTEEFITPEVDENKSFIVTFEGSYITFTGTKYEFYNEEELLVSTTKPPKPFDFTVTHVIADETITTGENYTIITQVKNLATKQALGVNVEDRFNMPLNLLAGITEKEMDLQSSESRQAYIYKIAIPENATEEELVITSFLTFEDIIKEHKTTLKIEKKQEAQEATKETTNTEETNTEEAPETEEEQGALTKLWNWIKGLFS